MVGSPPPQAVTPPQAPPPRDPTRDINLQGAITLGAQTLKSLELVNGGAAIGILTFYGNAIKGGASVPISICGLRAALIIFGSGVFMAVIASALAYVSQLLTQESNLKGPGDAGQTLRYSSITFGLLSAAAFLIGLICAAFSFG